MSTSFRPSSITLKGKYGKIEKLDLHHSESLWNHVKDHDELWTHMFYGPFEDYTFFCKWISERVKLEDPFSYAVINNQGAAVGIVTLMECRPAMRVIEVGNILYSPALKRTTLATEVQYLIAKYAFETLNVRRYEWKCDVLNTSSRSAAIRLGFTFEGIFRQHMIIKGRNRDTAWYSMLDSEWPEKKCSFERWLSPTNFDEDGHQLSDLKSGRSVIA